MEELTINLHANHNLDDILAKVKEIEKCLERINRLDIKRTADQYEAYLNALTNANEEEKTYSNWDVRIDELKKIKETRESSATSWDGIYASNADAFKTNRAAMRGGHEKPETPLHNDGLIIEIGRPEGPTLEEKIKFLMDMGLLVKIEPRCKYFIKYATEVMFFSEEYIERTSLQDFMAMHEKNIKNFS